MFNLWDGGLIIFFSGVLFCWFGMNCSGLGVVNGVIESLIYGFVFEFGFWLWVNCVLLGMIWLEVYDGMFDDKWEEMY